MVLCVCAIRLFAMKSTVCTADGVTVRLCVWVERWRKHKWVTEWLSIAKPKMGIGMRMQLQRRTERNEATCSGHVRAQRWSTPDKNKLIIKILIWLKQCAWKMTHASNIKLNGGIYCALHRHRPSICSRCVHTRTRTNKVSINGIHNWNGNE